MLSSAGVPARPSALGSTTPEDGVCRGCDRWVRECNCGRHRRRPSPQARHSAELKRRRERRSSKSPVTPQQHLVAPVWPHVVDVPQVDAAATALQAAGRGAVARRLRREEERRRRGPRLGPPSIPNPSRPNPRPPAAPPPVETGGSTWESPFAVPDDPRTHPPRRPLTASRLRHIIACLLYTSPSPRDS